MVNKQCLYLLLEVEKVRQNHRYIRTTFIYPTLGMRLCCCSYIGDNKILYTVHKREIEENWEVEFTNCRVAAELAKQSPVLYDTLENIVELLSCTAIETHPSDDGIWGRDLSLSHAEVEASLKAEAKKIRNKTGC